MKHFIENLPDYWFGQPQIPSMNPLSGVEKMMEMENDISYLKYLYPETCRQISECIEEECDRLEYDGSFIFDDYPDKTSLRNLAHSIAMTCQKNAPDTFQADQPHIQELIEVLLYHEVLFRRNRYRNRKRLYL